MEISLRERMGVPFYACTHPDWAQIAHGFSTRKGGVSPAPWDTLNLEGQRGDDPANVAENLRRFCSAIGADHTAIVKNRQVHSTRVRCVTREDILPDPVPKGTIPADALVTDREGVCLTVFSGDCLPVLLYDPAKRVIAAAHAGWRGTAQGVAFETAMTMQRQYGCRPEDIRAAIGPGISRCCFETHQDVPDALIARLGAQASPLIHPSQAPGKFHVDLKGANRVWLLRAGLDARNIALCDACTACQKDLFWSHRTMGHDRGSMAAMIQLL